MEGPWWCVCPCCSDTLVLLVNRFTACSAMCIDGRATRRCNLHRVDVAQAGLHPRKAVGLDTVPQALYCCTALLLRCRFACAGAPPFDVPRLVSCERYDAMMPPMKRYNTTQCKHALATGTRI